MNEVTRKLRSLAARTGLDEAWPALLVAALLLAGLAVALAPTTMQDSGPRELEDLAVPDEPGDRALAVNDTDGDGLADSIENYVYGSSPEDPDTNGDGVPDGYLAEFGYHPAQTDARNRTITEPTSQQLPDSWNGTWPDRYRMTVRDFYESTRPDNATLDGDPWWTGPRTPSPNHADRNDDGVPDAWFVRAGLDPFDTPLDEHAPEGNDTLTVRENLQLRTDPTKQDTDDDGITDAREASIGTDPVKHSTAGVGVADGWLEAKGFDPIDPEGVYEDPDLDGLTTAEEYQASREWMPNASVERIAEDGLDPFETDTSGNGIPDGWLVVHEIDPLDAGVAEEVTQRATDFEGLDHVDDGPGEKPALGDVELTVRDEYEAAKPASWNESSDGVWWGGTAPSETDTDGDRLPDAVEIRGWYVQLTASVDPSASATWIHVTPDPSRADSDADGLSDRQEYRGQTTCKDGDERSFPPTHPGRADSTFSSLSDREAVCGFTLAGQRYDLGASDEGGIDPTVADTDGDLIADGREARYWHQRATQARATYPFPDSPYGSSVQMAQATDGHAGTDADTVAQQLAPDGDWDGDGLANLVDPDSSSALASTRTDACTQASPDPSKVFLRDGPQIDPSLYRFTDVGADNPRPASDPASPDTDGDGLPDAWEIENAKWLEDAGTWSLSPGDAASGPQGQPDGEADPDGDSITYLAPPDKEKTYEHTNLQECRTDTDPHERSTDGDGVGDGWKVFWGSRYPSLVSQRDPLVGELTDEERSQIQSRAGSASLAPGTALTGRVPWAGVDQPVRYTRHLLADSGSGACSNAPAKLEASLDESRIADSERAPSDLEDASLCITTPDGEPRLLLPVRGFFNVTWTALDGTGANPYLDDTDRDEVPDWLEVLVQSTPASPDATEPPSPIRADAEEEFADDGLTFSETHEAWEQALQTGSDNGGPDPRLVDSDHDGLDDGDEVRASFDPRDPRTIRRLGDDGGDADADGIEDLREIQGWTHTGDGPRFETDPFDVDTDTDGLVDGFVDGDETKDELEARGIAHTVHDDGVNYLGESLYQADPTDARTSGDGVPDGWQAYYSEKGSAPEPTTSAEGLERAYEAGRPAWWEEADHGPWWWGRAPSAPPCDDLDGDGLSDVNGEDPFPARTDNRYVHGDFATTDPGKARAYVAQAPSPVERLERAQAWGPSAGDPQAAREEGSCGDADRPDLVFEDVSLDPSTPVIGAQLSAEGRVLEPDGSPASGVTVLASPLEATIDRVVGVGFTDSEGRFQLEGAIREDQSVQVPEEAVYRSTTGAQATWTATVDDLQPGGDSQGRDNRLVLWTYNTTTNDGAQTIRDTNFQALSSLGLEAPDTLGLTETTQVNATLADGLERSLADGNLTFTWDGTQPPTTRSATTDATGRAQIQLPEPDHAGTTTLEVSYDGEGPYLASQTTSEIVVRRPAQLDVQAEPARLSAGDPVTVTGTLTTDEGPVADTEITVTSGSQSTTSKTGSQGTFEARLTVPQQASPGTLDLVVEAPATDARSSARAVTSVEVLALTELRAPQDVTVPQTDGALLRGRVVDAQDRAVKTTVTLEAPELPREQGATDEAGRFLLKIPANLDAGSHRARLKAHAVGDYAASQSIVNVTVQAPTELGLADTPAEVTRGQLLDVAGHLRDARGEPVSQASIVLTLLDARREISTSAEGGFQAEIAVPSAAALGATRLDVTYEGDRSQGLEPAQANASLRIQAPTNLSLETSSTPLASPTLAGRLADADGKALPGEPVRVRLVHPDTETTLARAEATTSASGAYSVGLPGGLLEEASRVQAEVTYPGSQTHARSQLTTPLNLTTPLDWQASLPDRLVHGKEHVLEGTVAEKGGEPITEGTVTARLDGEPIASTPVQDGAFRLSLSVPEAIEPGSHELRVTLDPPGLHARTPLADPVTVASPATVDVEYGSDLDPGRPFQAQVLVEGAGGHPLSNVTVVYWIAGEDVPARAETDADGIAHLSGTVPTNASEEEAELRVLARGPTVDEEVAIASQVPVGQGEGLGLWTWALALGVLAALVVAGVLARRRRQQVTEAQEIVEELVRELEAGNEYEASVLWAYRNLVDHLEDYGFLDRPEHTAREFLDAVQEAMPLPEDDVDAFVEIFEETRYSERPAGPVHRTRAVQRLHRILERLRTVTGGERA